MLVDLLQQLLQLTEALQSQLQATDQDPLQIDSLLDQRDSCLNALAALDLKPADLTEEVRQWQAQIEQLTTALLQTLQQQQTTLGQNQKQLLQTRSAFAAYESEDLPEAYFIERES